VSQTLQPILSSGAGQANYDSSGAGIGHSQLPSAANYNSSGQMQQPVNNNFMMHNQSLNNEVI